MMTTLSKHISLSMFQCVIELNKEFVDSTYNLLEYWTQLYNLYSGDERKNVQLTNESHILELINSVEVWDTKIRAYPPGSLGKQIRCVEDVSSIGSLSVKFSLHHKDYDMYDINVSVLMFRKGKLKISGGLGKMPFDDHLNDDFMNMLLQNIIIKPVLRICLNIITLPIYHMQKKMINANMRRSSAIGKEKYLDFIQKITKVFGDHRVILPEIMQLNGKRRGRICAVKVKNKMGKRGSFAVDHSGNVQFFAYDNMDELRCHALELFSIWL